MRTIVPLLLAVSAVALATACGGSSSGSGSSDGEFNRVVIPGKTYELSDLEAIGYRISKTYDVNGLTGATSAYYGFWQGPSSSEPVDYEVRIYPSQEVAVDSGTMQAEEVTGDDAVLDSTLSSWTEGLRDRRRIVGGSSRGGSFPRYPDYVIAGNLVILCQGRNPEHAQERCDDFVDALR